MSLFFSATNAEAANGWIFPLLYAPSSWVEEPDYSRRDAATYQAAKPDSLMSLRFSRGELLLDPGPLARVLLINLGESSTRRAAFGPAPEPRGGPADAPTATA